MLDSSRLTIEKIDTPSLIEPVNPQPTSNCDDQESKYILELTNDQIQRLMNFDNEINNLILKVGLGFKLATGADSN